MHAKKKHDFMDIAKNKEASNLLLEDKTVQRGKKEKGGGLTTLHVKLAERRKETMG